MPELPEVETIRRQLEPLVVGARITATWAFDSPKFTDAALATGRGVERVDRRGKYLLLGLGPRRGGGGSQHDDGPADEGAAELIIHLGMTGSLAVVGSAGDGPTPERAESHVRAWWELELDGSQEPPGSEEGGRAGHRGSGRRPAGQQLGAERTGQDRKPQILGARTRLRLRDIRRFGRVAVVPAGDHGRLATLAALGPEPLSDDFEVEPFWRALRRSSARVKTQLLSQRPVAGVGNIYADEALWMAQVHPASRKVTRAQAERLRDALREALTASIERGGTTLRDYRTAMGEIGANQHHLLCYGRSGEPCRRCGATLRRAVYDGRTTTFCPSCQRLR